MLRSFAAILLLLLALGTSANAQITIKQHASLGNTTSPGGIAFPGAVTVGSTLIVAVRVFNATDTLTGVSDSVNGAYTKIATQQQASGTFWTYLWYFKNTGAGTPTVTITTSAGNIRAVIAEIGGVSTTAPLDGTAVTQGQTGTTAPATLTVTTTQANNALISVVASNAGGVTYTENASGSAPSSGWASIDDSDTGKLHMSFVVVSSTGTYKEVWTSSGSDDFATILAAFGTSGGGGGGATSRSITTMGAGP